MEDTPQIYNRSRYQGPSIVNEFELQKEIIYNNTRSEDEKETYKEVRTRCETKHFQGTRDENLYYRVATPTRVRSPDGDYVWENRKMYFKDFFKYLQYISLKAGPEPREDFFTNNKSYEKAHAKWEKKSNRKITLAKGSNWNEYVSRHPEVADYIRKCEEEEIVEREERRKHREAQRKRKRLLISPALVKVEDYESEPVLA